MKYIKDVWFDADLQRKGCLLSSKKPKIGYLIKEYKALRALGKA